MRLIGGIRLRMPSPSEKRAYLRIVLTVNRIGTLGISCRLMVILPVLTANIDINETDESSGFGRLQ